MTDTETPTRDEIPDEIVDVIEIGRELHRRAEALLEALDGIEAEAKKLKKAAKELRKTTPPPKR